MDGSLTILKFVRRISRQKCSSLNNQWLAVFSRHFGDTKKKHQVYYTLLLTAKKTPKRGSE